MNHVSLVSLIALVSASLAVACAAPTDEAEPSDGDDVTEQEANAARVTPGSFKLYAKPRATPSPSCDPHTRLELSDTRGSRAHLEEALDGHCEIAMIPNARDYRLRAVGNECGSRIFSGSFRRGVERYTIRITDHRTRICEDVVPAAIVVEETRDGEMGPLTSTKYSYDGAPAGQELTVEGNLFASFGIGGENTGASIATASGTYELVLDPGERNQFVDGKKARVQGKLTHLSGVETRDRQAIDVSSMLVCPDPGTVNCMPRVNVRLSNLCESKNRAWIQSSCAGVQYVD